MGTKGLWLTSVNQVFISSIYLIQFSGYLILKT